MARVVKNAFGLSLYEGMYGARSLTFLNKFNNEITLEILAPKVTCAFSLSLLVASFLFIRGERRRLDS